MLDKVGNPEDRFSSDAAHIELVKTLCFANTRWNLLSQNVYFIQLDYMYDLLAHLSRRLIGELLVYI